MPWCLVTKYADIQLRRTWQVSHTVLQMLFRFVSVQDRPALIVWGPWIPEAQFANAIVAHARSRDSGRPPSLCLSHLPRRMRSRFSVVVLAPNRNHWGIPSVGYSHPREAISHQQHCWYPLNHSNSPNHTDGDICNTLVSHIDHSQHTRLEPPAL